MTSQPTPHQRLTRAGLSGGFADLVLNQHAHQLAETIRQSKCDPGVDICTCCEKAADLIDPEAKAQP